MFTILNHGSAEWDDQTEIDSLDWKILLDALHGTAVYTGCLVSAQTVADLTVSVTAGTYRVNATDKTCVGGTVNVLNPAGTTNPDGSDGLAADATLPRYDLVVLNGSGELGVIHGSVTTPAFPDYEVNPVFPSYASNQCVIAAIYVPPLTTQIVTGLITPKDVPISKNAFHRETHALSDAVHTGEITNAQHGIRSVASAHGHADLSAIGPNDHFTGGDFSLVQKAAPSSPASGTRKVYVDSSTGKLSVRTSAGTTVSLEEQASPQSALRRQGSSYETFIRTRPAGNQNAAIVSQRVHLSGIELPAGLVVTTITHFSGGTALATGVHQIFGLYDSSRALLRGTSDDGATAWAANSEKTLTLTSTFTTTYSGLYYIAILVDATTVPTLKCEQNLDNDLLTLAPILNGSSDTGRTTLPNPAAAITSKSARPYAYVS